MELTVWFVHINTQQQLAFSPEILLGLEKGRVDFYPQLVLEGLKVHPITFPPGWWLLLSISLAHIATFLPPTPLSPPPRASVQCATCGNLFYVHTPCRSLRNPQTAVSQQQSNTPTNSPICRNFDNSPGSLASPLPCQKTVKWLILVLLMCRPS